MMAAMTAKSFPSGSDLRLRAGQHAAVGTDRETERAFWRLRADAAGRDRLAERRCAIEL
jgi:hypothetical protein